MKKIPLAVPVIFLGIGLMLAVVGWKTGDYFWYIRTGIFLVGAVVTFFLRKRK